MKSVRFQKGLPSSSQSNKRPLPNSNIQRPLKKQTTATQSLQSPIVSALLSCPTPIAQRQKTLSKFFSEFKRIYSFLSAKEKLASTHAISQELNIATTYSKSTYVGVAVSILKRLKLRSIAIDEDDVGIDGEYIERQKDWWIGGVTTLCHGERQLEEMGFPSVYNTLVQSNVGKSSKDTLMKKCDRCKRTFTKILFEEEEKESCNYHPGFLQKHAITTDAGNERVWSCCLKSVGKKGCLEVTDGHVWKEEDNFKLNVQKPFVELGFLDGEEKILALDCEMSYTDWGMEMTRVTFINFDGKVILDQICKPTGILIDPNTKWSGLTSQQILGSKNTLDDIQRLIQRFASKNTIFVGHGLENDMKVLRLIHGRIIDTSSLYPHPGGLPKRRGLKDLSQSILHRSIQNDSKGHDSVEDAMACVDLVKHYLKINKIE